MMIFVRSLLFYPLFYSNILLWSAIGLPFMLLPNRYFFRYCQLWNQSNLWLVKVILKINYVIEGKNNLPKGSCLLVANHQSAWETFALISIKPEAVYIVKRELFLVPLFGWYGPRLKMIPVKRGGTKKGKYIGRVLKKAQELVKEDRSIIIFPEGTRVHYGERKPFKKGVINLYENLDAPLIPVAHNAGRYWPKHRFLKHPGTIRLKFFPALKKGLSPEELIQELEKDLYYFNNDLAS